nr:MAG TPA: hypothetical protein [Caudoviricetes sp.]DAZ14053.1 MAG TPA: hypothetical protein [Caudoviricetes sp.]
MTINPFCFVGSKEVGEKSAKKFIESSTGHFTQKFRNA